MCYKEKCGCFKVVDTKLLWIDEEVAGSGGEVMASGVEWKMFGNEW